MGKAKYYTELSFIDTETGEVVKTPALVLGNKPTYVDKKPHIKIFVTFLEDLIIDKDITKGAVRLLLYILNQLDWEDLSFTLIPSHAMSDLSISHDTFYAWLKLLLNKNIIVKTDKKYVYELIPFSAIRGNHQRMIHKEATLSEENQKRKRRKAS